MPEKQNPYIISEDQVPESWQPIEAEPVNPNEASASAPQPATSSLPIYFRGSLAPNLQHDAQLVATDKNPRQASIPLMPLAPSANPQNNAQTETIVKLSQSSVTTTSTGLNFRGTWNPFTAYNINDVVIDNISAYVAIQKSVNKEPDQGNTSSWVLLGKNLNFRGVWAAFNPVLQTNSQGAANGNPTNVNFNSPVHAGSAIMVFVTVQNIGSSAVPNVSDSQGNSYTQLFASPRVDGNEYASFMYIAFASAAGSLTVDVSYSNAGPPGNNEAMIAELTNIIGADHVGTAGTTGTSGPFPAITVSSTNAGEVIFTGTVADSGNLSAPTGYNHNAVQQATQIAWTFPSASGSNTVQWNGSFNNSGIRFTGGAVTLFLANGFSAYNPYDVVEFNGSTYVCVASTNNSPATAPASWTLLAQASGFAQVKTANYAAVSTDEGSLLSFNGSNLTLTLPATIPDSGYYLFVQNLNATNLTISPNGLQIDGQGGSLTLGQFSGIIIFTDGTNYFTTHDITAISVPTIFTLSVNVSGVATIGLANENANTFFRGPNSGPPGQPFFGPIVQADLPPEFPRLVQSASNSVNNSLTLNIAFGSNNTAGDFLVLGVRWANNASPFGPVTYTVTDTLGNTWIKVPKSIFNVNDTVDIWYVFNCKGGANTVTLTYVSGGGSAAANNFPRGVTAEFNGMPLNINTFDQASSAVAPVNGTAVNSGNIVPTQAWELLIGFNCNDTADNITNTPGAGWTTIKIQDGNETLAYQIVQATGTYAYTATTSVSVNWTGYIASFEVLGGQSVPNGPEPANTFFRGPVSGPPALPVFGPIQSGDIPSSALPPLALVEVQGTLQTGTVSGTIRLPGNQIPPKGVYRIAGYMMLAANPAAGTLDMQIGWTEGFTGLARTASNGQDGTPADISTTATNFSSGTLEIVSDGVHDITFTMTLT